MPDVSAYTRLDYLRAIYAGSKGLIELRAIDPLNPQVVHRTFAKQGDVEAIDTFIEKYERWNIYIAVATRRDNTSGRKDNLRHLTAIYCDIDCDGDQAKIDEARRRLEQFPIPPSIIVQSGGGLHVYWLLREPMDVSDPEELAHAEAIMHRLALALGADPSCKDSTRVLRLPGTRNYKPKYGAPRDVVVEYLDAEHRINVEDLDEWLPTLPQEEPRQQRHPNGEARYTVNQRNDALFRLARSNKLKGISEAASLEMLRVFNAAHCDPPHEDSEVQRPNHSAYHQADRPFEDTTSPEDRAARVEEGEYLRERARRRARQRCDVEERPAIDDPSIQTLDTWLDEPEEPLSWRIEHLMPEFSRVLLSAQFKAGKTILTANLARCLVDGDPFLGQMNVTPITDGTVALLDFEMSPRQLKAWLRAQRIEHAERIVPVSFRGRVASFNILDADVRQRWARYLRDRHCRVLCVDCLRPIMDALGLDEHKDAGRLLVALDALCAAAGIREAWLVHHMGHDGERARGDSRLRDWPDVEIRLVRQDDNPASARFISAYGRDVELPESRLEFDSITRRLTLAGGSRHDARAEGDLVEIMRILIGAEQPLSQRDVVEAAEQKGSALPERRTRAALKLGLRKKDILADRGVAKNGRGTALLHRPNPLRESAYV